MISPERSGRVGKVPSSMIASASSEELRCIDLNSAGFGKGCPRLSGLS
ncbi:MAG: hypothetical protein U1E41_03145 [Paracoccus sp. (in: a-proteobacteria)]